MKTCLTLSFVFFIMNLQAQEIMGIYKRYTGTIDKKLAITADLFIADTVVKGRYYYNSSHDEINLSGSVRNGVITLQERVDTFLAGRLEGKITDDLSSIEGASINSSKTKTDRFKLQSFLPPGSVGVNSLSKSYSYVWHKNSKGESLGCTADYTYCFVVNMNDKAIQQKINESMLNTDVSPDDSIDEMKDDVVASMDDEFDDYIESYGESFPDSILTENEKYMDESPEIYNWKTEEVYRVLYNENYLLSMEGFVYGYTGGAHGNYGFNDRVYNLNTGDVLQLDDLFKPGYVTALTAIVENQLRKNYKVDSKSSLGDAGFFTEKPDLSDNFYIGINGIGILYNPYEIASYANGPIRVFLKWDQVQSLIKPDGPLAWVLKEKNSK